MLKNANHFVAVNFAQHLDSTTNFKMLISVFLTALMDTLKISTTFVFPLSFVIPLAAPAKPTTIPSNAQLAVQLFPHHFPRPHLLTTFSLRLEHALFPPPTTPNS
jgi:hypothetical protein